MTILLIIIAILLFGGIILTVRDVFIIAEKQNKTAVLIKETKELTVETERLSCEDIAFSLYKTLKQDLDATLGDNQRTNHEISSLAGGTAAAHRIFARIRERKPDKYVYRNENTL